MSKQKITRKELKGKKIISLPYNVIQNLLTGKEPVYYNSGIYGWNYDIYIINDVYIVTGYRPIGKQIPVVNFYARKFNEECKEENREELLNKFITMFSHWQTIIL